MLISQSEIQVRQAAAKKHKAELREAKLDLVFLSSSKNDGEIRALWETVEALERRVAERGTRKWTALQINQLGKSVDEKIEENISAEAYRKATREMKERMQEMDLLMGRGDRALARCEGLIEQADTIRKKADKKIDDFNSNHSIKAINERLYDIEVALKLRE